jgi:hypothetical protein
MPAQDGVRSGTDCRCAPQRLQGDRTLAPAISAGIAAHRDECRTVDLELASFVCVTSIAALTHTAVLHQSFSDEALGALVEEATRLIVRYLQ